MAWFLKCVSQVNPKCLFGGPGSVQEGLVTLYVHQNNNRLLSFFACARTNWIGNAG